MLDPQNTLTQTSESHGDSQEKTTKAFAFKWARRDSYESEAMQKKSRTWLVKRYCHGDTSLLASWLEGSKKLILDAGCGAGYSGLIFFADHLLSQNYLGVDISEAVFVARQRFEERGIPGTFLQADISDLNIRDQSVDIIFCEGVMHHTPDTRVSMLTLARKLKPGGRFLFYVYRRKSVIREFTDDFIRHYFRDKDEEVIWEALKPLTELGMELGRMNVTLTVPEDIDFLEIKAGKIDLQRFFYWHIFKVFYDDTLSLEEMNHINFDWYSPLLCHRHTPEEVESWCREADLIIENMYVEDAGISVVARSPR